MSGDFFEGIYLNISSGTYIIIFVLFIIIFVFVIFENNKLKIKKQPAKHGLFGYFIFYADQKSGSEKNSSNFGKILYSKKYDIQGKPDYIYKKNFGKKFVPIEIKSGNIGDSPMPHTGDMYQLAAYFLIIEDLYKSRPPYGRLVYKDYMFIIKNNFKIRREVKRTIYKMRQMLKNPKEMPNQSYVTCKHCICRETVCEYYK